MEREGGTIVVPMILIAAGYVLASWGWVLIKGWDISFRSWISPLNPYQWPGKGDPPAASPGRVFPAGAKGKGG